VSPAEPDYSRAEIFLRVSLFVAVVYVCRQLFLLLVPADDIVIRSAFTTFAGGAAANVVMARLFGTGRLSDIGLGWDGRAARQLLIGLGAGAGGAALMLGIPLALGMAEMESRPAAVENTWVPALLLVVVLAFGSLGEELTFHGYAFQFLLRSMGVFATILPVSALFGLVHMGNAHATLHALFNTMLFGFLLGFACWRTGALWLPVGVHFGWNLMLPLFGTNLSGFTIGLTGYVLRWNAGELWSGGEYGPEGGLLATFAAIAVFLAVRRVR
jgi:membrane protease YdiL (CAAX protease family)